MRDRIQTPQNNAWYILAPLLLILGCGGGTVSPGPAPAAPEGPSDPPASQGTSESLSLLEAPVSFTVVGETVPGSTQIEALVAPFRTRMGEEIQQVIGETTDVLSKAWPEGTLGNFATDAMLWSANQHGSTPVDMALTNNGGLRVPIGPGPVTLGHMYELMPFDNMLSILVLTGAQIQTLCDELANRRGEPIAGFTFRIETQGEARVARDISVGDEPLDPAAEYRIVINDYLANGGESFLIPQDPVGREDLPILLRDAFIEYLRFRKVIEPELQGRIHGGIGR